MKRYRLYIDESGDHTYATCSDPDARYLGLMGVLVEQEHYRTVFHPELERLKQQHFPHNPDDPIILVRQLVIGKKGHFGVLSDNARNSEWEREFLKFLVDMRAILFSVVIDKQTHLTQYGNSAYHPYHYCMTVMLERLRGFLSATGACADVMAESRGRIEDNELGAIYRSVWECGTRFISGGQFQQVLTSRELKLRKKDANIAGLQIADLIAAPTRKDIVLSQGRPLGNLPTRCTKEINSRIRGKFNSYGRHFLG